MDNEENAEVDSTDLPEWLAGLVKDGSAQLLSPEEGRDMLRSLFQEPLPEPSVCNDPDCNWPKDPVTLAALCVATFILDQDGIENQVAYKQGLVLHSDGLAELAQWTADQLSETVAKAREWEASQQD